MKKIRIARPTGRYSQYAPEWRYESGALVRQDFEKVRISDPRITGDMVARIEKLDDEYCFIETAR